MRRFLKAIIGLSTLVLFFTPQWTLGAVTSGIQEMGIIQSLDLSDRTIMLNDRTFILSDQLKVFTPSNAPSNRFELTLNQNIKFWYTLSSSSPSNPSAFPEINKIIILKGYVTKIK